MNSQVKAVGFLLVLHLPASAEIEDEVPLGIEAVTGIRSGYVHRGFDLADTSLEFQFATTLSLSKEDTLNFGLSHLAESDGDFSETTGYLEFARKFSDRLEAGVSLSYRDRNRSLLDSGFDVGFFASLALNDDWDWRHEINYDFAARGLYAASEITWSRPLSEKSFLEVSGGVSVVSDFENRDGLNDFFGRVILNYAWSDQIAFSPFVGTSIALDDDNSSNDVIYGGLWFQVIF